MADTELQLGLEPINFYDAPTVLATQLWDGEFSADVASKTIMNPSALSPSERDSFAQRLAASAGNSSVAKATANVLTNPWTWILFLTSPVGERPLGSLFKVAAKYTLYSAERAPVLASIGMLTSQHALFNSRSGRAILQFEKGMGSMLRSKEYTALDEEIEKVLVRNGLQKHGLDWKSYADGSPQQQAAKHISSALYAELAGMGRETTQVRTVASANGLLDVKDVAIGRLVQNDPLALLRTYGAEGLVDKSRGVFRYTAKQVFPDANAVVRLWDASPAAAGGNTARDVAGRAMVRSVMGDLAETLSRESLSEAQFRDLVERTVLGPIRANDNYVPMNVVDTFVEGKRIAPHVAADARWASAIRAGNSTTPRSLDPIVYHPDDLKVLRETLGSTPELDEKIRISEGYWADAATSKQAVRFHRINPVESVGRHMDGMSRTYAMFVQDVGEGVRQIDRELVGKLKPWNALDPEAASHRQAFNGERAGLDKTITELEGTDLAPRGGFSVADVLYGDYGVATTGWQRDTIGKVVIPRLMGRVSTNSMLKLSMITKAKEYADSFVNTAAASSISGSSDLGNRFVQGLKRFAASTDEAFEEGQALERFAIKTLHSSALGFNVPSAVVNMTQPFMFAGDWLGYQNVLKGYGEAFRELGAYFGKRASMGFKPISQFERGKLLRETHKFANWEGQDVLEVAGDSLETLEGRIHHSLVGEHKIAGWLDRAAFELPMGLFKNAEIINRNVAAHAAHYSNQARKAAGAVMSKADEFDNILLATRETQFGSHWMNMPQAFLGESKNLGFIGGRALANPLLRQFLTFPVRSFAAWTYVTPKIGGRQGVETLKGFVNDTARGLAVSAIGYEAVKGLVGADLSRAGFASAVTDIIPGLSQGRIQSSDTTSPVPLPPALDIPLDAIKAFITDDAQLWAQTASRVIPGGVAFARALGSVPQLPLARFVGQTKYADWQRMNSDGTVPVFDGQGTLIDFRTPARLITEGMGFDMGAFKDESQMMQYLLNQRDQIVDYRREYMRLVYGGEPDKATQLAGEFEKRFKVPLTVTKQQWEDFSYRRSVPRVERQLQRMSEDVREEYAKVVGATLQPQDFGLQTTQMIASVKAREQPRQAATKVDPATAQFIRSEIERAKAPSPRRASERGQDWGPFSESDFRL